MSPSTPSEETRLTLLHRVRNQADSESWSEFVALYEPLLMSYVLGQGLPGHDARDVVQDIFIKLFRALPKFEMDPRRGRFRTWLWQVTSTTVVDWARRRKRQAKTEEAVRQRLTSLAGSRPEPEPGWQDAYHQRVMDYVLEQVREKSQPRTWACFEQHLLVGRPSADVARELGLTVNAVNANSSRVLARVREMCAYYREELGDE
jgi:RNA polymerase sigma-70 factor (ECF subfamily)